MKKDYKNGFLLNENIFDNIEKLIINFNEVLQNTNIYNLDYIKFIMELLPI